MIERLKPEEAAMVLQRLLSAYPELETTADQIARSLLHELDFEIVADDLLDPVEALGFDDLHGRAGRQEWGYVEPGEAASEVLQEVVEPFVDAIKRQIELGLEAEALEICKGVILGLYRARHGQRGELLKWDPDFSADAAGWALETWHTAVDSTLRQAGGSEPEKRPAFPQDFVERFVPEWGAMIARILSRTR